MYYTINTDLGTKYVFFLHRSANSVRVYMSNIKKHCILSTLNSIVSTSSKQSLMVSQNLLDNLGR